MSIFVVLEAVGLAIAVTIAIGLGVMTVMDILDELGVLDAVGLAIAVTMGSRE